MGNNRGYCGWPSFSILTQRTIRTESQAAVGRWESAFPGHCADAAARGSFGYTNDILAQGNCVAHRAPRPQSGRAQRTAPVANR